MKSEKTISKTRNIILWIAQGLLASILIWAGFMKILLPAKLPFSWVKDHPDLVLFTGMVDFLGGIGIILPTLLGFNPKLVIFAAYGIIMLMVSASIFHISRGEAKDIGFNVFVMLMALFVSWGRIKD